MIDQKNRYNVLLSEDGENVPENALYEGQDQMRYNILNKEKVSSEGTEGDIHGNENESKSDYYRQNTEGILPEFPVKVSAFQRLKGMLMIATAGILLLSTTTLAKYLKHIPVGEFLFLRYSVVLMFIFPTLYFQQPEIDMKGKFKLIFARCFLGSLNSICKFWAVIKLDYGNAIALCACAPVFAALFSRVLWKEKINLFTIIALVMGLSGMVLIAKPEFIFGSESQKGIGPFVFVPIFGSMCLGLGFSLLRKIGKKPYILIVPLGQAICLIPVSAVFQLGKRDLLVLPECYSEKYLFCLIGFITMIAHFLLNRGLAIEKSGPGSLMRNVDMVFAYVIQVVLFNEPLELLSILGGGLIIGSTVTVAADKVFGGKIKVWEF